MKRLQVKEFSKLYSMFNLAYEFSLILVGEVVFVVVGLKKIVGTNLQRNLPVDKFSPSPTILEAEVVLWRRR